MQKKLTYEQACQLFSYDEKSGELYWKVGKKGRQLSRPAGTISRHQNLQYRQVVIDYTFYMVHRIIWLLHYKTWPTFLIDHIDGNGLNNKIENLRDATHIENGQNTYKHRKKDCIPNIRFTRHHTWKARCSIKKDSIKRITKTFKQKEDAIKWLKENHE